MGHSHSSPSLPRRMSDLPWQDGHYKCNLDMNDLNKPYEHDTILVKGNTVHILGFAPLKMTAGVFGKMTR